MIDRLTVALVANGHLHRDRLARIVQSSLRPRQGDSCRQHLQRKRGVVGTGIRQSRVAAVEFVTGNGMKPAGVDTCNAKIAPFANALAQSV